MRTRIRDRASHITLAVVLGMAPLFTAHAGSWPMLGRDATRNAVSPEKIAPTHWQVERRGGGGAVLTPGRNVRWEAQLGDGTLASPVVAGGLVWVGTNNRAPRDPKAIRDAAVLMCFRESDGQLLWRYVSPRLIADREDFPGGGISCSPLVEDDRLYFTTNRGEVLCFDIAPLRSGKGEPRLLWKLDMRKELGVRLFAYSMLGKYTCSIGSSYKGRLYVSTGNGRGADLAAVPAPNAPSLVCLEARTGKVLWSDRSPGKDIICHQWSSPLVAEVNGKGQVIAAQGDGWLRSFDALTGELLWQFDLNPKKATPYKLGGSGEKNFPVATPVLYEGRVYIATGQDVDDGPGVGHLWCIDPGKTPTNKDRDVSPAGDQLDPKHPANKGSALVWHYGGKPPKPLADDREFVFGRTMSSVAIHDGLLIAPELAGYVHCLDARTGKCHWVADVESSLIASPLIAGGKVYVPVDDDAVWVFALSASQRVLARNKSAYVRSAPAFANGTLYLAASSRLLAVRPADEGSDRPAGHWPGWRGPDRLNLSADRGLLEKWPKEGPSLLWQVNGIGQGVGPAAVAGGTVYVLGHRDRDEYLTAVDETSGKPRWSVPLGPSRKEYDPMRWLSQRTPLVDGDRVYAVTALGQLACVSTAGKLLWRKDYAKDFEGRRGAFGVCDQLLVDGDRLIAVPGGSSATVIALDRRTGAVVWKCPVGDTAGYVGAVLVGGEAVRKHYVAVTAQGLVGVSTDGKILWRDRGARNTTFNSYTPNVLGNKLFWALNSGRGAVLLELRNSGEGVEARQTYQQALATPSWQEMVVCVGSHAYVGVRTGIACLDLATGKVLWQALRGDKEYSAPYSGTWADGRLYLRTLKGVVLLVKASKEGHSVEGMFQLPGTKPKAGSTSPVVTGGRLYLRDEERLFCYDVTRGSKPVRPAVFEAPPAKGEEQPSKTGGERGPDAIYVPTPHDVVEKMLELAKVKKTDTLVDLGCGDGRIVVAAARKYGCKAIGYDIDPECVRMSLARVKESAVEALVTIEKKDLFTVDLAKVDVVALYLPPRVTGRLLPRLEKLPPGARVVSHAFALPGVKADREVVVTPKEDGLERKLYLYTAPLKKFSAR